MFRRLILHAPIALIAGLFAGTILWGVPQGGLEAAPIRIVAEAAQGSALWSAEAERLAFFD